MPNACNDLRGSGFARARSSFTSCEQTFGLSGVTQTNLPLGFRMEF